MQTGNINISELKPGDRLHTVNGNIVEVTRPSDDGKWVSVSYIEGSDAGLAGTADLCSAEDLAEMIPVEQDATPK